MPEWVLVAGFVTAADLLLAIAVSLVVCTSVRCIACWTSWKRTVNNALRQMIMDADVDPKTGPELSRFVDRLIEHCAVLAELQANVFTGEHHEAAGCRGAASSIRAFGKSD